MVLTVVTVAVSYLHFAVPLAITIALIIAIIKGSLVANFFMHLSHERLIIYASLLLTVAFFVVLLFLPLFTQVDTIGVPHRVGTGEPEQHGQH
jgi:cytochrome c oxidase subunit 4